MTYTEAVSIMEEHNLWRRGADIPMGDPKQIGEAIDMCVLFIRMSDEYRSFANSEAKK